MLNAVVENQRRYTIKQELQNAIRDKRQLHGPWISNKDVSQHKIIDFHIQKRKTRSED